MKLYNKELEFITHTVQIATDNLGIHITKMLAHNTAHASIQF